MKILIRIEETALVDSGCSKLVAQKRICHRQCKQDTIILTADWKSFVSHGVGSAILQVAERAPLQMEVLIVDNLLLGIDLLLRIDIIKFLGGECIDKLREAHFVETASIMMITIA